MNDGDDRPWDELHDSDLNTIFHDDDDGDGDGGGGGGILHTTRGESEHMKVMMVI